jgi:hypothetical protein
VDDVAVNGVKYQLKQCEVIRFEDEFGHSYEIDGEPVAGVTTLLSMGMPADQGLLEYFKRTSKEEQESILEDAQDRGSNVHQAIEALLLGEKVASTGFRRKREKLGIAAFIDFFYRLQPTDVVTEQVLAYKDDHMVFAGTLDLIATIGGKRILIDFKTSTAHSRKNECQVEAYKAATEQSSDEKIDLCYILYVGTTNKGVRPSTDKNGLLTSGVGWKLVESLATFDDFKRAYDTALFMNNGKYPKPPKIIAFPEVWKLLEPKREEK